MKPGQPLRRKTPLRARRGLDPGIGLNPVNPERRKWKFERNFGPKADDIRKLSCFACQQLPHEERTGDRIEAAHAKARGMGGCGGDRRHLVPLCTTHHLWADARRLNFEERFGDLMSAAAHYDRQWALVDPR